MWDDLLGVSWKRAGTGLDGIDCYNLARLVKKRAENIDLPTYDSPGDEATIVSMILAEEEFAEKLEFPIPYCFVLFTVGGIFHIGVVLEDKDQFIHILKNSTVSIERLSHAFWRNRIRGFYKWDR